MNLSYNHIMVKMNAWSANIGEIYGGTRGTGTPTFWTDRYSTPHFSGQKGEEFTVTCCQQRQSAEIKLQ